MLHVGIDEAGYGPLLGPLVVGACALRLADDPADLRRSLKGLVVRRPRNARASSNRRLPVPVDDSKVIHRRFGIPGLARAFGVFASAIPVAPPADLEDLLLRFSDTSPRAFAESAWYGDLARAPVPRYPWTGPLDTHFRRRGVEALDLRVLPLCARDFNEQVRACDNKASVLGLAAGASLLSILDCYPGEDADVIFDRHGSRSSYGQYLGDLFPFASIAERGGSEGVFRYDVRLPDRRLSVSFATRGDQRSLAVGWASIAAKLTRELFMHCLNAFFGERVPDLAPTAGYTVDGRRWMGDVAAAIAAEGFDVEDLVRIR